MKKIIYQQDEKDCGVACIAMILKHYGTEITIQRLRELSGTDLDGTSAFGIKKTFEKLGFDAPAFKAGDETWQEKDIPLPLIAHIISEQKYQHYVVVYKVKGDEIWIADPAKGKIRKTISEFSKEWTGVLLFPKPKAEYKPSIERVDGLSSFFPILIKQKSLIFHTALASLFITIFGIISSYYFQGLLDNIIPNQARSTLNILSIGLIFVYLFRVLFEYSRSYLLLLIGQRMSMSIMLGYFKHVLSLPLSFFATRKSGEIISRFLDANKIIDALASATLSLILDIGMVILVGTTLAIQSTQLFLLTLAFLPFYILVVYVFIRSYDKANTEEMSAGAEVNSSIIESLKGIETIKSYNGENHVYDRVDSEFVTLMKKSFKSVTLDNVQQSLKMVIELISSVLILWLGSSYVIDGKISLGQLITYNALLVFFTEPLQNIINLQVKMQKARVANKRLNEIMSISPEQRNTNINISKNIFNKDIKLDKVSFSYNMKLPVLRDVSLEIYSKSKVALVGVSGSGKSTLAKLLVKFYDPSEGNITYGDINCQDIENHKLRNHVTYVPQESFFFNGTIIDNLTFGLSHQPEFEKILEACKAACLVDFINQQPLRFDSVLEEGGNNLSGGQKQRLAIARAILNDSEIIIFDEATSGLDTLLEKEILEYLIKLQDKTIIFIAHHLSIAKACDEIIVLDQGILVGRGTHEELSEKEGVYRRLLNA
ncbi:peptide cleavage/export ABC transporter [Lactococcus lactis]|uniref:Competence-stimulating peptide ABC transporter ATP-binding protein ComA n=1 Tax=Lactococcus lactis subsp. lactis TaxID=1360 RepID=A0A0V8DU73_LACLL|nr:peptide cleavage/export ABC transporter [Lactococcus lactis]KSU17222.1 Competence-stimulating peptide ABC transporter ATP-binding protein ComA [Lactococcus lactis subsp. lactis]KSU26867.1 Competence-stimulating peptide ABC transporter ATP-binding protein ComA [Lactococcus lactis subsp. lactis]MDU0407319.1 Lactococcin-G-processing and transport ATP-binding protein LagD [Lactococcus lactis]TRW68278.1 peptide cleavage/export ABC transporter [Lactococcus lactis]TRW75126.1 peptide cleavage/expor